MVNLSGLTSRSTSENGFKGRCMGMELQPGQVGPSMKETINVMKRTDMVQ